MIPRLAIEPLSKAAFAPFGEVVESEGAAVRSINEGTTDRRHRLAAIDVAAGGRAIVSIFEGRRRPLPLAITMLERHPLGSQCFYPLQPHDWLVVVGQVEDGAATGLRCFRARGNQGVNYAAGTWHFPLLVLRERQEFLVVDREGPEMNCDEAFFAETAATVDVGLPA